MNIQPVNLERSSVAEETRRRQRELQLISSEVLSDINRCGFSVVKNVTAEEYDIIGQNLGKIVEREDIRVVPNAAVFALSAKAIPLHNDGPEGAIISLYCQKAQAGSNVGTGIVDVSRLLKELPEDVITYLKGCKFTRSKGRAGLEKDFNVLTTDGEDFVLYFVPWYHPKPQNEHEVRCLETFLSYVTEKTKETLTIVTLQEGEAVFFDNHHFLHGRGPLTQDSERYMKRLWIDPHRGA